MATFAPGTGRPSGSSTRPATVIRADRAGCLPSLDRCDPVSSRAASRAADNGSSTTAAAAKSRICRGGSTRDGSSSGRGSPAAAPRAATAWPSAPPRPRARESTEGTRRRPAGDVAYSVARAPDRSTRSSQALALDTGAAAPPSRRAGETSKPHRRAGPASGSGSPTVSRAQLVQEHRAEPLVRPCFGPGRQQDHRPEHAPGHRRGRLVAPEHHDTARSRRNRPPSRAASIGEWPIA